MSEATNAIAIVGLGSMLPDAPNVQVFWENIIHKRYSIGETPADRWSVADYYDPDPKAPDKTYSKIGGWVRDFSFDWKRFRIPPKVASAMDMGQQWAVEIADQALRDYGYPERALDTERTAVVFGTAMGGELHYLTHLRISFPEFANALKTSRSFQSLSPGLRETILDEFHQYIDGSIPAITEDTMPGELPNIVSGRVANVLNLRGPNFITDAACAASFAAVSMAVEMLNKRQVDAVLTGGVDRNMGVTSFIKFCKVGALSATGTRPFGDGADGFVMGEGAAAFLLKRLDDAERDGDRIYAVIRGAGGASDGRGKGIYAPNPIGQKLAMQRAWESAGLDPSTATLIEAHGTSTRVGDVVEVGSMSEVFAGAGRQKIALGSVKSNIGHLKSAAGAAGLLKATLALYNQTLPPTLNSEKPNPTIDFANSPFHLNHEAREWKRENGTPRRVGVGANGFGGTNFHVVVEEYVPGMLKVEKKVFASASHAMSAAPQMAEQSVRGPSVSRTRENEVDAKPLRGIMVLGAETPAVLQERAIETLERVEAGWVPEFRLPTQDELTQIERVVIDFGSPEELKDRLKRTVAACGEDAPKTWKALQSRGVFRGRGNAKGKLAFLFPGQGSQYVNMGRALRDASPVAAEVFAEADQVMKPILGKPLSEVIFVDSSDAHVLQEAEEALKQTAVTQPAMLTLDTAIYRLMQHFGFQPDMVMGHSLGEYAALIATEILPFSQALEAAAARGREMTAIKVEDPGWMAAVIAPFDVIQEVLAQVDGYVVPANINSQKQCVIGGESRAVEQAMELFEQKGYQAKQLPVSHAFHTRIVAPASQPLRALLDRFDVHPPKFPLVANVTGEVYPQDLGAIKMLLEQQIASPVQWVKGLQTLFDSGCRMFVEVGPKRAMKGLVDEVFELSGSQVETEVQSLATNHPKQGDLVSLNMAICGLYAAGYGVRGEDTMAGQNGHGEKIVGNAEASTSLPATGVSDLVLALQQLLVTNAAQSTPAIQPVFDRNLPPTGSVVISGTGLGLPGAEKRVMDPENALRVLRGEQFVDLIPERFRKRMLDKRITRLVKGENGEGHFETLTDPGDVIKLAGRPGAFDLSSEYGVPEKLVEALDVTSQLAMAAGLDALREAGIPLVMTYRRTSTGKFLPDRWQLPESLRDESGVIFASAFPGSDRMADEFERYYAWQARQDQLEMLEDLRRYCSAPDMLVELDRRIVELRSQLSQSPYEFDRRFLFRILSMGHSQFAEYIGARGPNTQVNAACASTTQAIALAEDWIRSGRCRRVIVIGADAVTGEHLLGWVGAGFLATGAAATDDRVEDAVLPFDRRRHGTIIGMGACALVVESEDALRERGMRGIVELLSSESANSAFHGTRLDVEHISMVMDSLVSAAERRFGVLRQAMAAQTVFMSHETYTPARGGSASAEAVALRKTFGELSSEIVVANTKGFTGHPMGVGIEDVIAVKILEYGIVPPVPNFRDVDPDLGRLNLSRGGRYGVQYAIHLAAGFGSQIAMTLTRRIPGKPERVDEPLRYRHWLAKISGYDAPELEVKQRVLRIQDLGGPGRPPAPSDWVKGTAPQVLCVRGGQDTDQRTMSLRTASPIVKIPTGMPPQALPAVAVQPVEVVPLQENTNIPIESRIWTENQRVDRSENGQEESMKPASPVGQKVVVPSSPEFDAPAKEMLDPTDKVVERVMEIVAEKTGYPREMLEMDLDLEADLGVDTVKQAETFQALREAFDIPRKDDLRLRDYPTLGHVVGYVKGYVIPSPSAQEIMSVPVSQPPQARQDGMQAVREAAIPDQVVSMDEVMERVMAIVAEKTGYPREMLEMDLDLEADLGVDTVKQAETFQALREAFDIPREENLQLRDYPTLAHVVGFVKKHVVGPAQQPAMVEKPLSLPVEEGNKFEFLSSPASMMAVDHVVERVMEIVAEKTGYPREMLEMDLDLEADLGVDTVKQAETFQALREAFDIPRQESLQLRDYPTLAHVVGFVKEHTHLPAKLTEGESESSNPTLTSSDGEGAGQESVAAPGGEAEQASPFLNERPVVQAVGNANLVPRRRARPVMRPPLVVCKPTGVILDGNSRVLLRSDQGGVGQELAGRLRAQGVDVIEIPSSLKGRELQASLSAQLDQGSVQGVFWLAGLDVEETIEEMALDNWREQVQMRIKDLYLTMRALYEQVAVPGCFLVAGTRQGGLHGYGPQGALAPLGGGVSGFCKAYQRERPEVTVKVVDFAQADDVDVAEKLLSETLLDPSIVEVGYFEDARYSVTLMEEPLETSENEAIFPTGSVFLVTGAAGSITSAISSDLAAAGVKSVFYLLDLAPQPEADDPNIALFRQDRESLKRKLISDAKQRGEKATPVQIEKLISSVERQDAALRAIQAVQACGGEAHYFSLDLRDAAAVSQAIEVVRKQHGKIDVLIHAAGLEISKSLGEKPSEQFDLVFDVKADGIYHILHASRGMPIGTCLVFSSVAGRFGNSGQADYSAANDFLCKLTQSFVNWRKPTRGIAIDWSAWGGIGMATRGSIPKIMEMAGIDMLDPQAGIPTVRRELLYGTDGESWEIVVGGRLGILLDERDPAGGVKGEKNTGESVDPKRLMVGKVMSAPLHGVLQIETVLDPKTQPFLYDHAMDGTPLLPGVMGSEAFAQAAQVLLPNLAVTELQNVRFHSPFKYYRNERRTFQLDVLGRITDAGDRIVQCELKSSRKIGRSGGLKETRHFAGEVMLGRRVETTQPATNLDISGEKLGRSEIYAVYFHGPAYQVLERAQVDKMRAIGWLQPDLPVDCEPAGDLLIMPRLLELVFQTAGVWQMKRQNVLGLPLAYHRLRLYEQSAPGLRICAVVDVREGDDGPIFDAQVINEAGKVLMIVEAYQTVALPGSVML